MVKKENGKKNRYIIYNVLVCEKKCINIWGLFIGFLWVIVIYLLLDWYVLCV